MCRTKSNLNARNKKTEVNNQWAGSNFAKTENFKEKTEFSNEWASTNKMVTDECMDNKK